MSRGLLLLLSSKSLPLPAGNASDHMLFVVSKNEVVLVSSPSQMQRRCRGACKIAIATMMPRGLLLVLLVLLVLVVVVMVCGGG